MHRSPLMPKGRSRARGISCRDHRETSPVGRRRAALLPQVLRAREVEEERAPRVTLVPVQVPRLQAARRAQAGRHRAAQQQELAHQPQRAAPHQAVQQQAVPLPAVLFQAAPHRGVAHRVPLDRAPPVPSLLPLRLRRDATLTPSRPPVLWGTCGTV